MDGDAGLGLGAEGASERVGLLIERIDALPTLSAVATRLMSLGSVDDVDFGEVVSLLESDPALTTTILGLCRRAGRGMATPATTVRRAAAMVGLEAVRMAALSVSVFELMADQSAESDRLGASGDLPEGHEPVDRTGLWKHAVAVACAAELLAGRAPGLRIAPAEAFVAGLLHDVGRLVLELAAPRLGARASRAAEERGSDSAAIERQLIGMDHHAMGRRVAEKWGLPESIRDVMWLHGQPLRAVPTGSSRGLVGLVKLAKAFCRVHHLGWSGDFGEPADPVALAGEAGVPEGALEGLLHELVPAVSERAAALGLDGRGDIELLSQSIAMANRRLAAMSARVAREAERGRAFERALRAIEAFTSGAAGAMGFAEAVGRVGASAAVLLGGGGGGAGGGGGGEREGQGPWEAAVLARLGAGGAWRCYRLDGAGRVIGAEAMRGGRGPGAGSLAAAGLTGVARGPGRPVGSMRSVPWLAELAGEAGLGEAMRVLPVVIDGGPDGGLGVLLAHRWRDAELEASPWAMSAVAGVWAGRLGEAAAAERAARLHESLAVAAGELAEAQARLIELDGLARLGEMTAGAAHELNTPLAVAQGRAELLVEKLEAGSPARAEARVVVEATAEAAAIVRELHALAMPPRPQIGRHTAGAVVGEAVQTARSMAGGAGGGEVRVVGLTGAELAVDAGLAARALAEVVRNAFEAAPGLAVEIEVGGAALEGAAAIRVTDTGPGFSERALRHAFDPFFSEKAAGRGRGMGLAMARRLVELMGGSITVRRGAGGGTGNGGGQVTLVLPLAGGAGEGEAGSRPMRRAG